MTNHILDVVLRIVSLLLIFLMIISVSAIAEPDGQSPPSGTTGEIYAGSIPSGDGVVSVKATSGKLYQIPAMSPLGVVQALAGTESIESYRIGDELMVKKGILILDGINNISYSGDTCWFVLVNNRELQDYLLPSQDALNIFPLKNGDVVLFAYGNPTRPITEATATMTITIGSHNESGNPVSNVNTTITSNSQPIESQVPTPSPTPVSTPSPVVSAAPVQTPAPIVQSTPEPTPSPTSAPVTPTPESTSSGSIDPNQPMYEHEDSGEKEESSVSPAGRDPNLPVYGDESESEPVSEPDSQQSATVGNTSSTNDPNQPIYETSRPESVSENSDQIPAESETEQTQINTEEKAAEPTEESTPVPTPTIKTSASGQIILYEGSMSLPSGSVNVTADSGEDYDIAANTPLGLLQNLFKDGKISSLLVSDRGMRKGGILTVTGINEYQYGDEGWFTQINENPLKDYLNPGTDGLNIKTFGSGDKITFYYGKLDQPASSAKAAIYITID